MNPSADTVFSRCWPVLVACGWKHFSFQKVCACNPDLTQQDIESFFHHPFELIGFLLDQKDCSFPYNKLESKDCLHDLLFEWIFLQLDSWAHYKEDLCILFFSAEKLHWISWLCTMKKNIFSSSFLSDFWPHPLIDSIACFLLYLLYLDILYYWLGHTEFEVMVRLNQNLKRFTHFLKLITSWIKEKNDPYPREAFKG